MSADRPSDDEHNARAGEPDARARQLIARMRRGDISRARVALAAFLGDPSARLVLAWEPS